MSRKGFSRVLVYIEDVFSCRGHPGPEWAAEAWHREAADPAEEHEAAPGTLQYAAGESQVGAV